MVMIGWVRTRFNVRRGQGEAIELKEKNTKLDKLIDGIFRERRLFDYG